MKEHQEFLERLIKSSQTNTEVLLETYFQLVNGDITEPELLETLTTVSENILAMQSELNLQLRNAKKQK